MSAEMTGFAATQVWQFPFVLLFIIGVVMSLLSAKLGRARPYAASGFGLLLLGSVVQSVQMYQTFAMQGEGNFQAIATMNLLYLFVAAAVKLGGFICLLIAVLIDRVKPTTARPGGY
jgi:hypothetical protein